MENYRSRVVKRPLSNLLPDEDLAVPFEAGGTVLIASLPNCSPARKQKQPLRLPFASTVVWRGGFDVEKETNVIVRRAGEADISALCHFETQARLTEPGVLVAEFKEEHYAKFLKSLQLEFARDNAIFIAADGNQVVGRCDVAILNQAIRGIVPSA